LDTSETAKVPNGGSGVSVLGGASGNRVGGAGKGNTIAGNGDAGVLINGTLATFVFGNRIGTNAVSAAGLGNTNAGVGLFDGAVFNHIGNTAADFEGAGNIISGNGGAGVDLGGIDVRYNDIFNNEIGTNDVGTTGLPNALGGVRLFGQATNNFIGSPGQGNLISGNSGAGVTLSNAGTCMNSGHR
jgi:hypothetical protein